MEKNEKREERKRCAHDESNRTFNFAPAETTGIFLAWWPWLCVAGSHTCERGEEEKKKTRIEKEKQNKQREQVKSE